MSRSIPDICSIPAYRLALCAKIENMEIQGTGARPKNWLVESILVTLFCCLPLGIVGIVNAANVNSRYDTGDLVGADRASKEAGRWTKIGFWVGLGLNLLVILAWVLMAFVFVGVAAAAAAEHN